MPGPGVRHGNRNIRRGTSGGPRQPRDRAPYAPPKPVVSSSRPVRPTRLTDRQLRKLSPTFDALHRFTSTDVLHAAGSSDGGLNHVLQHLAVPPQLDGPPTFAEEKKLRQQLNKD